MIRLTGISKTFHSAGEDIPVFHDINVEVQSGDRITILGPSGSGKTTFLKIITGLLSPDSGKISVNDKEVVSKDQFDQFRKQNIGYVPQFYINLNFLTMREQIHLSIRRDNRVFDEKIKHEAEMLLDVFQIREFLNFYPFQLSGGQIQRFEIIKTLLKSPNILILDEPTSALDYEMTQKVVELFQLPRYDQTTILLATHDLRITKICDKEFSISNGSLTVREY